MLKSKKIAVIDNYDSFTYNLVHQVQEVSAEIVKIFKNDTINIADLAAYDYLILSPGPGLPDDAGLLKEIIRHYGSTKKILGVCLGLQAIGEVFGAKLKQLDIVFHGIKSKIHKTTDDNPIFSGLDMCFEAGRYHSWVIDKNMLPDDLIISAVDEVGEIMAIRHRRFNIFAVQFHPESYMTPNGKVMMRNFLSLS